jgi:Ca2+-transporting ATPase
MYGENNWYNISWVETVNLLEANDKNGLSEKEAKSRQRKLGKNKLPEEKPLSQTKIFLNQLQSPLVYILIIAGIITLFLNELTDAIVIFSAIILNIIVGFVQESKASKALRALKNVLSLTSVVVRDGRKEELLSDDLVPGDIIFLRPGDKVPADARLIDGHNLKVNESALTGEWLTSSKNIDPLPLDTPLADRDNMVYMGTAIEDGWCKAIVVNIGLKTEIGRVNSLVGQTKERKTPYQKKIDHFSKILGIIIGLICFVIFIEGIITGGEFIEMFTVAVAVAVASIPEGLPVALTVILALGMQKILKRKGLVRKLIAAETLGSTSVIATDKTGTLTEAKMKVAGIYNFSPSSQEENLTLKSAILCSEAFIENIDQDIENWQIKGMPTERALILAGAKAGLLNDDLPEEIDEVPFSSEYKYSASLREDTKGKKTVYVKGAPEIILEKSSCLRSDNKKIKLTKEKRGQLIKKYEELTSNGYRVLGVAYKEQKTKTTELEKEISDLTFLGLIYLEDPVRKTAKEAIQTCYRAGMRPIIITGDHKLTARAVMIKLGFKVGEENTLEGKDLDKMSDEELDKKLKNIQIYARVEPKHKLRIIRAWQQRGEVVAMTGDGINDAPALKQADIGVALGSGTEVAKEIADLVLLTDDFSIIVAAVEEGRAILDNIRKVITYLLSDSFTEIILVGFSIVAGLPLPVTAVQILWVNLIEDGLPSIALAFEPKEKDLMEQQPQPHDIPLLTREMKIIVFVVGLITDFLLLALLCWLWGSNLDMEHIRTIVFACLAFDSISYVFCCKSLKKNLWHIDPFNNKMLVFSWIFGLTALLLAIYLPVFNKLLGTTPLSFSTWLLIVGLGVINVILIETVKYYFITKKETDKT